MSHSVTVTRTTTTTTTSALIINTGYLKTWPGLLKLFQTLLGIVVVGLISYYYRTARIVSHTAETFYLLMAVTFLVGTFLILVSCIISISTASIISKTIFEVVYHTAAAIMYIAASVTFLVEVNRWNKNYSEYEPYMAAGVIGLVISILYVLSAYFARKSYRGL
ncbi:uncharacterized protein [Atheta coriaria]|uniref:uncharacterized protein n=1 Tax=Dalotia coriaria TaxID=877792 RepID=UPI0031F41977